MPRVMKVIQSEIVRGDGTPTNISRMVTQYFTLNGKLLAEHDPCPLGIDPCDEPKKQ